MEPGPPAVGMGYSVTTPAGVIRPTRFRLLSVNHRLPSGPAVISYGRLPAASGYSVITPAGVMEAILPASASATQMLPSGPVVMPAAPSSPSSDIVPSGVIVKTEPATP